MKKILNYILIILMLVFINTLNVFAKEKNIVNIHMFYSKTCPHCAKEQQVISDLQKKYDNVKLYKYEVSEEKTKQLLNSIENILDFKVQSVPFTVIGEKYYSGYNENTTKSEFINVIEFYSENGYKDFVGEIVIEDNNTDIKLPTYEINENIDMDNQIEENSKKIVKIPFIGKVDVKNLALPLVTVIIGLLDGFNPCAMWILLFLISMLIGMNNKKRMLLLGLSFILTSALIYFFFMIAWLNITTFITKISLFRTIIGVFALICGIYHLYNYYKKRKESGCDVVDDKKRGKIFDKIKKFTHEKSFLIALIGIITLAVTVNFIELACSAGLPVMFIEILNLNNLTNLEYYLYIILYVLFFMLDDIVVFIIAITTMELTGFSTKYGKLSKLIGGILLVLIGLLMLIKPEWLMFNF